MDSKTNRFTRQLVFVSDAIDVLRCRCAPLHRDPKVAALQRDDKRVLALNQYKTYD